MTQELDNEFLSLVDDALCARALDQCGTGANAYQSPDYLQLQAAEAGMVVPEFEVRPDADFPLFVCQYVWSVEAPLNTGMANHEDHEHLWNVGVILPLSRDIMGLSTVSNLEFRRQANAAARLLMFRIRKALHGFAPSVFDSTFNNSSDIGRVRLWRPWIRVQDNDSFHAVLYFEWSMRSEVN